MGYAQSLPLLAWPGDWLNSPRCGSDNASRLPPANLRCSAPLKGPGKPPATDWPLRHSRGSGNPEQCARLLVYTWIPACAGMTMGILTAAVHCLKRQKTKRQPFSTDRFLPPVGGAEQRRRDERFRLALFEPRSGEFSQPPDPSSSTGHPRSGRRPRVAFFFGYFLLVEARRKYARRKGGKQRSNKQTGVQRRQKRASNPLTTPPASPIPPPDCSES